MPESRFVAASRLRPLLLYCAGAVLAVIVADVLLGVALPGGGHRLPLILAWMVSFPFGAWVTWRRL